MARDGLDERDRPGLVTPEAVVLDLPLAGIGSRGVAFAIDAAVMGLAVFALTLASALIDDAFAVLPAWVGITVVVLSATGVIFGYPIAFETLWRGRTLGKAALGLRVVTTEGGPIRLRHAATRAILGIVDFHITGGAAAVFTAFINRRSQRLGDVVAGTLVVRERSGAVAPTAATFSVPAGLEAVARSVDVSGIDPAQYQAIRTLLRRADTLDPATLGVLSQQLVERLHPAATAPVPAGVPPVLTLQLVAASVQARSSGAPRPTASTPAPPGQGVPALARPLDVWAPDGARDVTGHTVPTAAPAPAPDGAGTNGFTPPE